MTDRFDDQPPIIRYFDFTHLPDPLQQVASEFASLAMYVADCLPSNAEQRMALRKLLEAKDCAVRAALDIPRGGMPCAEDLYSHEPEQPQATPAPAVVPAVQQPAPVQVPDGWTVEPVEVFTGQGLVTAAQVWPQPGETVPPTPAAGQPVRVEQVNRPCCQTTQHHPGTVFIDPAPAPAPPSAAAPQPMPVRSEDGESGG